MQCSRCRTENEDDAKFCAACGSSLQKVNAPLVCHICSHANTPSANFCVACGAHLRRRSAAAQAAAGIMPAAAEARTETAGMMPPRSAYAAEAASKPLMPPERLTPPPTPNPARPDFSSAVHQENFESAALRPPRVSGFELKAGLAVLVLVVGGGLYWWSSQNDSRLAELALTARTPASPAIHPVAGEANLRTPPPVPDTTQDTTYLAAASTAPVAVPPTPTAPTASPAAPVTEAASKNKSTKHKNVRRRRAEPEVRQSETVVAEPAPQVVAEAAPPPVEKRKPNTREQVASCRRMSLFDGERCLWRICDGRWGKDGCPSYN